MKRELIAQVAHEVNRAYCQSLGDTTQPAWADAPDWQKSSALVGVDMHLAKPDATPEQSHESWLAQKLADGWTWGETKDPKNKQHPCVKPYAELPAEQKAKDFLFRGVVHALKNIPDAEPAKPPIAPGAERVESSGRLRAELIAELGTASIKATGSGQMEAVTYVGKRDVYKDGTYGTGLVFAKGETKLVPTSVARLMLRHPDVYLPGKVEAAVDAAHAPAQPTPGQKTKQEAEADEQRIQDARDNIAAMDKKASIIEFAKTNFRVDLSDKHKVADLKTQATRLIDQYGLP